MRFSLAEIRFLQHELVLARGMRFSEDPDLVAVAARREKEIKAKLRRAHAPESEVLKPSKK